MAAAADRRRRMTSQERRREFIEKAIEFFAEEGFESSTRELARRLGVTQPLLYRYFPSKDELIAEVYRTVYLERWRPDWEAMIADRSVPLHARLVAFYEAYTEVVFKPDWMRIFLYAGLKGTEINRRYLGIVRQRILIPIVREVRADLGLAEDDWSEDEVEYTLAMHGGIYYFGVRRQLYETSDLGKKGFVIRTSLDAYLLEMARLTRSPPLQPLSGP